MKVMITKESSELTDLVYAAIKTTYDTRSRCGVERCMDVLKQLKSLSLSVKDIQLSDSICKLASLKRHRHPEIRKEAKSLFDSWSKSLYAHGRDNSFEATLTKIRLKPMKHVLTRCSEVKKYDQRSLTREAEEVGKNKRFLELNKSEDERSQIRETKMIKKETKAGFLESKQKDGKTCEEKDLKKETKTDLKPLSLKRRGDACEAVKTKKPRREVNVTATALPQHSRQNIKDKDPQVTTKNLIPPPRRDFDSRNPRSAAMKTKKEEELDKKKTELVELFEAAKKAADVANAKGLLSGKPEASRCVDALSLLMRINITLQPKEPKRMMERLEGLTKHKDRKICHAATALLNLWQQRI